MNKMKCLVTGGSGFIGSHVVDLLLKENYDVVVVDNFSTGNLSNLQHHNPFSNSRLSCRRADFTDYAILQKVRNGDFDFVFHLAATASVPYSVKSPVNTNDNNVTKSLLLLEACRTGKVKKFIFSSSSSVYGNSSFFPTTEETVKQPLSPYALQKSVIEDYCKLYQQLYGLESICLRYFNVFGPRQSGSGPYANVISSWCESGIKTGRIRLDGKGEASRDFVSVQDVAKANLLAANSNVKFGCYNVGSGKSLNIAQILTWFKSVYENIEVVDAPARAGDPLFTQADISLTKNELGFISSEVDFLALNETFKWYKENIK